MVRITSCGFAAPIDKLSGLPAPLSGCRRHRRNFAAIVRITSCGFAAPINKLSRLPAIGATRFPLRHAAASALPRSTSA